MGVEVKKQPFRSLRVSMRQADTIRRKKLLTVREVMYLPCPRSHAAYPSQRTKFSTQKPVWGREAFPESGSGGKKMSNFDYIPMPLKSSGAWKTYDQLCLDRSIDWNFLESTFTNILCVAVAFRPPPDYVLRYEQSNYDLPQLFTVGRIRKAPTARGVPKATWTARVHDGPGGRLSISSQ